MIQLTQEHKEGIMELEQQIKSVAEVRRIAKGGIQAKNYSYAEWEKDNAELLENVQAANQRVAEEEVKLRELTLGVYALTGNKTPAVGVGIREVTIYSYDSAEALTWAKEHDLCLKLDDTAFKKQVKVSPLSFVTSTTEPQATIAQELPD